MGNIAGSLGKIRFEIGIFNAVTGEMVFETRFQVENVAFSAGSPGEIVSAMGKNDSEGGEIVSPMGKNVSKSGEILFAIEYFADILPSNNPKHSPLAFYNESLSPRSIFCGNYGSYGSNGLRKEFFPP